MPTARSMRPTSSGRWLRREARSAMPSSRDPSLGDVAVETSAHRLEPEVGSRIDHRCLSVVNQQDRGAQPFVVRIGGCADAAMASERRHSHGRAGTKHRKLEYGMRYCGQGGSSIKAGTGPFLASQRLWPFP